MTNIPLEDILRLPLEERLDLVERIWDSIAADQAALPLDGAHRRELDRRLDAPAPGPSLTWEEVQQRLREQDR
jgi:putative addiction module component (TIGR02574 family)